MNLIPLGANKTELYIEKNGHFFVILFSYRTPVAARRSVTKGWEYYKTEQYFSRTTSKHIKTWLPIKQTLTKPQSFFDGLVA